MKVNVAMGQLQKSASLTQYTNSIIRFFKFCFMAGVHDNSERQFGMRGELWTNGYKRAQLEAVQDRFKFVFPPDFLDLLLEKRPVDGHDWTDHDAIGSALNWPLEGLLFDVEQNSLWWPEWGEKPTDLEARAEIVTNVVSSAPILLPIISHRYIPDTPNESGNPIFSVYQADIIYYGSDLNDYFAREFGEYMSKAWPDTIKEIPFWSEMERRADDNIPDQ